MNSHEAVTLPWAEPRCSIDLEFNRDAVYSRGGVGLLWGLNALHCRSGVGQYGMGTLWAGVAPLLYLVNWSPGQLGGMRSLITVDCRDVRRK